MTGQFNAMAVRDTVGRAALALATEKSQAFSAESCLRRRCLRRQSPGDRCAYGRQPAAHLMDTAEREAHMAPACYRLVAKLGLEDLIYNPISLRLPGRECGALNTGQ